MCLLLERFGHGARIRVAAIPAIGNQDDIERRSGSAKHGRRSDRRSDGRFAFGLNAVKKRGRGRAFQRTRFGQGFDIGTAGTLAVAEGDKPQRASVCISGNRLCECTANGVHLGFVADLVVHTLGGIEHDHGGFRSGRGKVFGGCGCGAEDKNGQKQKLSHR